MGRQSYMLFYKSTEQRKQILQTIYNHNNEKDFEIIGETLHSVCCATPIKRLRDKGILGVILCGHGGGRHYTCNYFDKAFQWVIKWQLYNSSSAKLICKKNQVLLKNWETEII